MSGNTTRQLYIYWKVDAAAAPAAISAAQAMQAALSSAHPGLQATLHRRAAEPGVQATVMEVYAKPGGVDAVLQAAIESAAAQRFKDCATGPRHVEVFEAA